MKFLIIITLLTVCCVEDDDAAVECDTDARGECESVFLECFEQPHDDCYEERAACLEAANCCPGWCVEDCDNPLDPYECEFDCCEWFS